VRGSAWRAARIWLKAMMAPEAFFEVGGRASAGWYSSSSSSSSAVAARAARWGVLVVEGAVGLAVAAAAGSAVAAAAGLAVAAAAGSAVAAAAAERETLLVGGAERGFLFLLREAGGAEDIAAVGLVVLGACLDLVFLRFYPKDWTLFTFSGVSGCLRHYSVATHIRGVGVITKGSRHRPT
jgi:hypothetical protein